MEKLGYGGVIEIYQNGLWRSPLHQLVKRKRALPLPHLPLAPVLALLLFYFLYFSQPGTCLTFFALPCLPLFPCKFWIDRRRLLA